MKQLQVAKWKEFLKPILAESEKRSKIDMHEYGLMVINKIGNVNDSKTFKEVVETGKTPAYFLTMLQLVNLIIYFFKIYLLFFLFTYILD